MYWLEFFISSALIVFSGVRLTKYADKIGDRFNIGKTWIGVILLGFVTSLPEAIASLTSVISLKADDLAIGNLLGSYNFNLLLIVFVDLYCKKGSISNIIETKRSHYYAAGCSLALLSLVFVQMALKDYLPNFKVGIFSPFGVLLAAVYFLGMRKLAILGKKEGSPISILSSQSNKNRIDDKDGLSLLFNVLFSAGLVIIGSVWLVNSADIISQETGLGRTFVGSIFLAIITSLPEMVVTISAVKLGSFDLAIGNIFGSNMTNMFIVSLCDFARRGGLILNFVSKTHISTAILGMILTVVAVTGLINKNKKVYFGLGFDSWMVLLVFITGNFLIYKGIFIH